MESETDLLTVGAIARETGQPLHRVRYALETYRIEPVQRAGILRLFSRDDLPRIKSALARIAERRGGTDAR
jgi:predicted transcriptional regulator